MKSYTATDFQSAMQGPDPRLEELTSLRRWIGSPAEILAQSQSLIGTVLTERGLMDIEDALVTFGVSLVVYRFGTWVVTEDGIACLAHHYPLTQARLHEQQDWVSHLAEHPWVNLWDLLRALTIAQHLRVHREDNGASGDGAHPS
jgi:hypothetical protein